MRNIVNNIMKYIKNIPKVQKERQNNYMNGNCDGIVGLERSGAWSFTYKSRYFHLYKHGTVTSRVVEKTGVLSEKTIDLRQVD